MKKVIPCPINEKDLCSDMLFEGLFDNDEYCENKFGTVVGFINGGVAKLMYSFNSHVVFLEVLDKTLDKGILKQVSQWLKSVEESVNDNAIDGSTSLKTVCLMVNNTCTISFHYVINN